MTTITLVEDEPMVAKRLQRFVEALEQGKATIVRFSNLDDAHDHLEENGTDLLFLDLNLHGKDGFTLLKAQLAEPFHTIVVSANTDRALEAFDLGVLDFIGKPFTKERIAKALERYHNMNFKGQCAKLTYKKRGRLHFLHVDNIQFIQAAGHYCEITTKDDQTILHDKHLDKLMQILPNNFFRIHRSYAVRLDEIESTSQLSGGKYYVHLQSGTKVPVGRTKYTELLLQLEGSAS